jgi:FKBP-type peptidyl-prolyl cis-trans isomerase
LLAISELRDPPEQTVIAANEDAPKNEKNAPGGPAAPNSAKRTHNGLSYVLLTRGKGAKPTAADALELRVQGWAFSGLERKKVLSSTAITLAPDKVPAGLGPFLLTLETGSLARVWLPKPRAQEVTPDHAGELILDIEVVGIASPE